MNRSEFQALSEIRVLEAKKLLDGECFHGAYYLLGYAVEFAFKSCIAKQTKRYDFPDKNFATNVYTHDLSKLLKTSGLEQRLQQDTKKNATLELNWAIVKDWNESSRYKIFNQTQARELYSSITSRSGVVLSWIRQYW